MNDTPREAHQESLAREKMRTLKAENQSLRSRLKEAEAELTEVSKLMNLGCAEVNKLEKALGEERASRPDKKRLEAENLALSEKVERMRDALSKPIYNSNDNYPDQLECRACGCCVDVDKRKPHLVDKHDKDCPLILPATQESK